MQKFDEAAHGVYVIAATPFRENGQVDMASVDSLVDFYLEEGVHGMTVLGVMGEAPKLTDSEQTALLKRYLARVGGRVPVVVGVSNPGIDNLVSLSKASMDAGADGVMIAGMAFCDVLYTTRAFLNVVSIMQTVAYLSAFHCVWSWYSLS